MPEEINTHLFIGGSVDGEYFNIPSTARRWSIPILQQVRRQWIDNPETIPESVPIIEDMYYRFRIAVGNAPKPKHLFVFVHESIFCPDAAIYPKEHYINATWNIMCRLVNNYKVIK